MSRWCDRSIRDVRHSEDPIGHYRSPPCLELTSRKPSWPAVMCDRTERPDIWAQAIRSKYHATLLRGGSRPHIGSRPNLDSAQHMGLRSKPVSAPIQNWTEPIRCYLQT